MLGRRSNSGDRITGLNSCLESLGELSSAAKSWNMWSNDKRACEHVQNVVQL